MKTASVVLQLRITLYICRVKAVANGALAWHIDTTVSSRVSKYHYGTRVQIPYQKDNKEFQRRNPYVDLDGVEYVNGAWSGIVEKVGI